MTTIDHNTLVLKGLNVTAVLTGMSTHILQLFIHKVHICILQLFTDKVHTYMHTTMYISTTVVCA